MKNELNEALEWTSLLGNISYIDNQPFAHLHSTLGSQYFEKLSRHLTKVVVSTASEMFITITDFDINRTFDS